ncbi:MAG: hypothetical protein HY270_03735 [Deltaproteobacteria bacterium]|nr:hypothetical protein [Deltaproteobacteria bacterium]
MQQPRITDINVVRCSRCGALLRKAARAHRCLQALDSFHFAEFFWDEA